MRGRIQIQGYFKRFLLPPSLFLRCLISSTSGPHSSSANLFRPHRPAHGPQQHRVQAVKYNAATLQYNADSVAQQTGSLTAEYTLLTTRQFKLRLPISFANCVKVPSSESLTVVKMPTTGSWKLEFLASARKISGNFAAASPNLVTSNGNGSSFASHW